MQTIRARAWAGTRVPILAAAVVAQQEGAGYVVTYLRHLPLPAGGREVRAVAGSQLYIADNAPIHLNSIGLS